MATQIHSSFRRSRRKLEAFLNLLTANLKLMELIMYNQTSNLLHFGLKALLLTGMCVTSFSSTALAQTAKTYDIDGFTGVSASAGVTVDVKVGSEFSVSAEYPEGYEDRVSIRKRFNTLNVGRSSSDGWVNGEGNIIVQVTMPKIAMLEADSGGRISAAMPDQERVNIKAFSGGRIVTEGSCDRLKVQAASGGRADLSALECTKVSASAYSGGGLKVYASQSIRTRTDSAGTVLVFGNPENRDVKESDKPYSGRTSFQE